jgi:hypothetical protein
MWTPRVRRSRGERLALPRMWSCRCGRRRRSLGRMDAVISLRRARQEWPALFCIAINRRRRNRKGCYCLLVVRIANLLCSKCSTCSVVFLIPIKCVSSPAVYERRWTLTASFITLLTLPISVLRDFVSLICMEEKSIPGTWGNCQCTQGSGWTLFGEAWIRLRWPHWEFTFVKEQH